MYLLVLHEIYNERYTSVWFMFIGAYCHTFMIWNGSYASSTMSWSAINVYLSQMTRYFLIWQAKIHSLLAISTKRVHYLTNIFLNSNYVEASWNLKTENLRVVYFRQLKITCVHWYFVCSTRWLIYLLSDGSSSDL